MTLTFVVSQTSRMVDVIIQHTPYTREVICFADWSHALMDLGGMLPLTTCTIRVVLN